MNSRQFFQFEKNAVMDEFIFQELDKTQLLTVEDTGNV